VVGRDGDRREWGSLYDALAVGSIDVAALRGFLRRYTAHDSQPVYAVDLNVWLRCNAKSSPDRGFYSHPSRHSAGQPIVAGWEYQLVVTVCTQLPLARLWIADRRLPWERPLELGKLTPSRIRRAHSALLPRVGTPARAPNSFGVQLARAWATFSAPPFSHP
jgi:hypothetical protein